MKKIALVAFCVLTALAVVGVGYALWFEWIYIDGSVSTGTLDAVVTPYYAWDTEPLEKDFSNMTIEQTPMGVYCTITNAYPSIDYYGYFTLANAGTIPFHTDSWAYSGNLPAGATLEILLDDWMDVDGDLVYWENLEGWQFHPGDSAYCMAHVHLANDAEQGASYYWIGDLITTQWNEGNYGGQVLPRPGQ